MQKYYSQNGEDFLLDQIFKGKPNGFFVEIGCLEGIVFSNTYAFEKKGWKGICVEAHNGFIAELRRNRNGSTVIHCAVGEADKDNVTFYANKIGSLSTLDKKMEDRWNQTHKSFFYGFEEQIVNMRTLTTIFDENKVSSIDFISLDIEGYEVEALLGLDLNKYRPRLMVIEYKDEEHKNRLEAILSPQGYIHLSTLNENMFYGNQPQDKFILDRNYGKIQLTRLSENGGEYLEEVELKKPSFMDKVVFKLRLEFNKMFRKPKPKNSNV